MLPTPAPRRIHLPDDRCGTAVAFVQGYDAASGWASLKGFQEYVAAKTGQAGSPVVWAYLIASARVPDIVDRGIGEAPAELGIPLTDTLLDLLEAFVVASGGRLISDISDIGRS